MLFESPNQDTTKNLYISLVRPIIEYASYIGRHNILVTRTELSMYRNNSCCLHFVLQIGILVINLSSLINCRTMLGVIFMHTLITGEIASCGLTSQLNFCIPTRLTLNYRP